MVVLVTGGAGFIGSWVVRAARGAGHDVRVLDDLSTGDAGGVPRDVPLVVGDVADPAAVARALGGCDAVVHLAAHRAVPRSVVAPLATDRANTGGTLAVLDAAQRAGVARVVCASSSSVYGQAAVLPTPEDTVALPRSPYAVSKLAGEHYARVFEELYGLSTLSLRFFNVYGPGQDATGPYAQLVPRTLVALRAGVAPVVDGDGTQSRDLVYASDVAAAVVAAVEAPAVRGVLNVGSGRAVSVLDVVAAAAAATGRSLPVRFGPGRAGDVVHTCADITASGQQLSWKPEVSLAEGLRRCAAALS